VLSLLLWGLAYICAAPHYVVVRPLVGVFALEKALYAATWIVWMLQHAGSLSVIYDHSPLTALALTVYGPVDISFAVFFAWVFIRSKRGDRRP
jgi:hypothetical protein